MENYQDSSNDKDAKLKRSFEGYESTDEAAEKKKKEKKAKEKKAQQQKTEQAKRSDENQAEEDWFGEKKPAERKKAPSLLSELLGEEQPEGEEKLATDKSKKEKPEHVTITAPETTEPDPETIKLAELSPDEQRQAAIAYVSEREARLAAEAAQIERGQDTTTAKEATANQSFLRRLKTKLLGESEDRPTNELLDEAANETCSELEDAVVAEEVSTSESEVIELGQSESTPEASDSDTSAELDGPIGSNEDLGSFDQENIWSQRPISPTVATSPSVNLRSGGGGSGGIGGGAGTSSDGGRGGSVTSDSLTFGNAPNQSSSGELAGTGVIAARKATGYVERGDRRAAGAGEFLLGAFVGYLFGRRRGRINSEAEHEPVKKQLEQKVKQLQSDIEEREVRVRSAARQEKPSPFERQEFMAPAAVASLEAVLSQRSGGSETIIAPQNTQEQVENITSRFATKESIATMPLPQVLEQAKQITYHGESLRDMYEADKIDEKALRETIKAFQSGERHEQRLERGLRQLQEAAVSVEALEQQRSINEHPSQESDQTTESIQSAALPRNQNDMSTSQTLPQKTDSNYEESSTKTITPMRQASIGALIGIVFVIVIILVFGLR